MTARKVPDETIHTLAHPEYVDAILSGFADMIPVRVCVICGSLILPVPPDLLEEAVTAEDRHTRWHALVAVLVRDLPGEEP